MASKGVLEADGFMEDAAKLLKDFAMRKSVEFKEFAEVWKKNNFVLVFMGKANEKEMTEFTGEVFRLSLKFLSAERFYEKVGAVYLLYSLYQNKPFFSHSVREKHPKRPASKVRVEERHWEVIQHLFLCASEKKFLSLLYVLNYLKEEALLLTKNQASRGPWMAQGRMRSLCEPKQFDELEVIKAGLFSDLLEFQAARPFEKLGEMWGEYLEMKKELLPEMASLDMYDPTASYAELSDQLDQLLNPEFQGNKLRETLGEKRDRLKTQAFRNTTVDKFGVRNDELSSESEPEPEPESEPESESGTELYKELEKLQRRKKVPKHERRVGRPRKTSIEIESKEKSDEDEFDIGKIDVSALYEKSKDLYLPILPNDDCFKPRVRRQYYKPSPKRTSCDE